MLKVNDHIIEPTIFPDGTSQVWKLPDEALHRSYANFHWEFEEERELVWLLQAAMLFPGRNKCLFVPYLPYGRQDKAVENKSTFALEMLFKTLEAFGFETVHTLDMHGRQPYGDILVVDDKPDIKIADDIDTICFPDASAALRYQNLPGIRDIQRHIVLDKDRNPTTGAITGLKIRSYPWARPERILIVDDICDGGRTFIEAAKLLRRTWADPVAIVDLWVTHGIFSKGTEVLFDAGIRNITTYKGKVS